MRREASYYIRMALGVRELARTRPASDPDAQIRDQLSRRDAVFLDLARRVVFANPKHPYHEMFRLAGCAYEDLARSVGREGLEKTLARLHAGGVRLSHDEFKGKQEIVRSGGHIPSTAMSFQNPLVRGLMESSSSGSRSKGTLTRQVPEFQRYRDAYFALATREFGLQSRAEIQVRDILPSGAGLGSCLRGARMGRPAERWFAISGSLRHSGHYRAVTFATVLMAKLSGARVPFPRYLAPNDFSPVAAWIARRRAVGVDSAVYCSASMAVRIAAAAVEGGCDIRGALFFTGGEALTAAKRAAIEAAGAEAVPVYWIHEIGPIGMACRGVAGNSVHHFRDSSAVIACPRPAPLSGVVVNSLAFTTLLSSSPRFLINAEMDDAGDLREAACGCAFSRAGFTATIHDIFSYGKLTGHGMTLVGTDILQVLEERLPARLGGHPGDYQLVEREGSTQTQIVLRVSPRVGLTSPDRVKCCFLEEIRGFVGGAVASRVWGHADGVEVHIAEPYVTRSGKVLPLHLLGGSSS